MSLLASRRCVRAAAESNQPRRCRALSRSSEHIPSAAHTMTARAITTHARAVLVLASCAALLPAVQSLPTRAPTAKPTAFMPLPPLPTLAPSSSPAAGSDDGMSSSTSPTAYRDLNPPRPTYAGRDSLWRVSRRRPFGAQQLLLRRTRPRHLSSSRQITSHHAKEQTRVDHSILSRRNV